MIYLEDKIEFFDLNFYDSLFSTNDAFWKKSMLQTPFFFLVSKICTTPKSEKKST